MKNWQEKALTVDAKISCGQHALKKLLQTLGSVNLMPLPAAPSSGPETCSSLLDKLSKKPLAFAAFNANMIFKLLSSKMSSKKK